MKTKKGKAKSEPIVASMVVTPADKEWDPSDIAMIAEREDDKKPAETHIHAIQILRDQKNFSFREIAEWLLSFNVKTDSNSVYRAYMNHAVESCQSRDELAEIEREAEQEMEQDDKK